MSTISLLTTPRLQIRPFQLHDWPAVYAYMKDPAVTHYLEEGQMTSEQTQVWLARQTGERPKAFAVVLQSTNELIGHIGFHEWFHPRIYELSWAMHRDHQGRGYATEAAAALLPYGFETLGVQRVIATCQPENVASWRVMEKLGMQREGHLKQCIERPDGSWWDEYFYAILRSEWRSIAGLPT